MGVLGVATAPAAFGHSGRGDIGILTKKQPFAACGRQVIKKELDSCPN